jgi:hypothetical protein
MRGLDLANWKSALASDRLLIGWPEGPMGERGMATGTTATLIDDCHDALDGDSTIYAPVTGFKLTVARGGPGS